MSAYRFRRVAGVALASVAVSGWLSFATAYADGDEAFLSGSTHALVMGPTGMPDPSFLPGYIPGVITEYLRPLGFSETGTVSGLWTPETPFFGPSVADGVDILVRNIREVCGADECLNNPLTIFGYSQSAVIASLAERELAGEINPEYLRFVMIGDAAADPASGPTGILDTWGATPFGQAIDYLLGWSNLDNVTTPKDLFPTAVFTVAGDYFADTATPADFAADPLGALWHDFIGLFEHAVYLGGLPLTEITDAIAATEFVDGGTTYITLADPVNLLQSLFDVALGSFGITFP